MDNGLVLGEKIVDGLLNVRNVVSVFLVIFMSLYFLFSILVVRQVQLLHKVLGTGLDPVLKVIAFLNLIIAAILLITSIVILV